MEKVYRKPQERNTSDVIDVVRGTEFSDTEAGVEPNLLKSEVQGGSCLL